MKAQPKNEIPHQDIIKKYLVGLIMIAAAALGLTLVIAPFMKYNNRPALQHRKAVADFQRVEVDKSSLPEKFPFDIPLEKNAVITQNYNATAEDGSFQATRAFLTEKSLAENLAIYKKYFIDNDWKITATVNQTAFKKLTATRGGQTIEVSINDDAASKLNTVSITLTEAP